MYLPSSRPFLSSFHYYSEQDKHPVGGEFGRRTWTSHHGQSDIDSDYRRELATSQSLHNDARVRGGSR